MSSSYNRNIERMRSRERANTQQAMSQNIQTANVRGQRDIDDARDMSKQLSAFSATLARMAEERQERHQARGAALAQEHAVINAEKLIELQEELSTLTATDTRYHEIKAEMLRMSGPDIYPDAERIAQLSPWEQTGYLKEKLRSFNDTFAEKLNHSMMTSEKALKIENITFTPKELHDNNIHGMPFKEAAVHLIAQDIRENAGLDNFSPELLELAGTNQAIQSAKEQVIAKYRARYNVESSSQHRSKAETTWKTSQKTGEDIYHYLVKTGATVDGNNNIVGNAGAWKAFESILVSEGVSNFNDEYALNILNQPMPDSLAIKVGAKKGTTYAEHWPSKASNLQLQIQDGIKKSIDAENDWLETSGTQKQNEFITEVRENGMTEQRANEYKRWYGEFGLTIPDAIKNWESANDISVREAKDQIDSIIAYNKGEITHAQLDQFPAEAALEYRDKADKFERAALTNSGAEKKIKAALDSTFADMGIKTNEKSLAYIEANENAKADFLVKRNKLIGMGYDADTADHLALYAQLGDVKDEEGNPIPGEIGVITEIENKRMGSKYATFGLQVENSIGPDRKNVRQINIGKKEILENRGIITTGIIGGTYGETQITSIKSNLEKFGPKGLYRDEHALNYYKGLARGRDETWPSIIDAQLKVTGHEGLWPDGRPPIFNLLTGKDEEGNDLPDADGAKNLNISAARALNYPSVESNLYATLLLADAMGYKATPSSIFDLPENIDPAIFGEY